ncbi:hypothetical protein ACFY1P_13240 [Streptomyces sp. NPDC001407]|uniref:hypothetical protein n=1 Tax=Streptomyces sp. NPDC001407 TaxID=3364573 RepID=UPI00369DDB3C
MPLDPARATGAYLRAQVYRDHASGPPPAAAEEESAGSPSPDAEPEIPSPAPPEPALGAAPRPPRRLTRLLLFLRQGPTAAPDARQP